MTRRLGLGALLLVSAVWMGCSGASGSGVPNLKPPDSGVPDSGMGEQPGVAGIQIPQNAPYDTWTWIPVQGTKCADGSPAGFALNPHSGSSNLVVYFEGGGACWTPEMCRGPRLTASRLNGLGDVAPLLKGLDGFALFSRTDTANPVASDNLVFVPYCTGDIHSGNNVATYTQADGSTFDIQHVGYANAGLDLAVIQATFAPERVVVTGSSAGGYGALINYERIHAHFPAAPAFLIDDSGPPISEPAANLAWYQAQEAKWHTSANLPAGCTQCALGGGPGSGWNQLIAYYAKDPNFRGSLLQTERDGTISAFYSLNELFGYPGAGGNSQAICIQGNALAPCQFRDGLLSLFHTDIETAGPGKMKVYFVDDFFHTFLGNRFAPPLKAFVNAQLTGGTWDNVVP